MRIRFLPVIFNQAIEQPIVPKMPLWKTVAFAAGLGLSMLSSVRAPPATGGDTVQGPCDSLLSRMQNGRTLGQSGRFHAMEPVIRCAFDIASVARLSVGP